MFYLFFSEIHMPFYSNTNRNSNEVLGRIPDKIWEEIFNSSYSCDKAPLINSDSNVLITRSDLPMDSRQAFIILVLSNLEMDAKNCVEFVKNHLKLDNKTIFELSAELWGWPKKHISSFGFMLSWKIF